MILQYFGRSVKNGAGAASLLALFAVFDSGEAHAACLDEVKALYANELNAYDRPPYRAVKIYYDVDGNKKSGFDHIVETPLRTISFVHGGSAALTIDRDAWTGPTSEGPWTKSAANFPKDRRETHERIARESIANMTDAKCGGSVEIDGKPLLHFGFTTKSDPDPEQNGQWFGAKEDVYLDPDSKRVMRWEQANFISSWSKDISRERTVQTFEYDETIKVNPPE